MLAGLQSIPPDAHLGIRMSLGTLREHCVQVMMEKTYQLLIWHNMLTDRHERKLPSVCREHLTDGNSFVYFFPLAQTLERGIGSELERVPEGRRGREGVCEMEK